MIAKYSSKSTITEQCGGTRGRWSESGQTFLEMALLLPIFLALLIGVIDLGRYTYFGILVGNAARAGAEYGIQGHAQSKDAAGIIRAAKNDFQSNGQDPANLTVAPLAAFGAQANFDGCTCDNGGAFIPAQPATNYCTAPPNGTNNNAGSCTTGHWVVLVGVEATGTFNSLFIPAGSTRFGITGSITVDRTSILRVSP
jgi:Flp pilus assembly protein TadG